MGNGGDDMIIAKIVCLYLFIGIIVAFISAHEEFLFDDSELDVFLICILLWTITWPYELYQLVCIYVDRFKSRKKKNK